MNIPYSNPWFRIIQEGNFHFVDEPKSRNAAAILIRHMNGDFILAEIFRPALGRAMLEIPRGYADEGETSLDCAIREAFEETGYRILPDRIRKIGTLAPNSGILSTQVDIYFAEVRTDDRISTHGNEVNKVIMLSEDKLLQTIAESAVADSFTTSALLMYRLSGRK